MASGEEVDRVGGEKAGARDAVVETVAEVVGDKGEGLPKEEKTGLADAALAIEDSNEVELVLELEEIDRIPYNAVLFIDIIWALLTDRTLNPAQIQMLAEKDETSKLFLSTLNHTVDGARMSTTTSYTVALDPSQYDAEQIQLMEERLILLDYHDNPIGEGSKKDCTLTQPLIQPRIHY